MWPVRCIFAPRWIQAAIFFAVALLVATGDVPNLTQEWKYGNIWKYIDISWHIMTCRKHEELSIEMGDLCRWMVRGARDKRFHPQSSKLSHCWHKDSWGSPSCWETKRGEIFTTSARFLMTAVGGCPSISFIRPIHSKLNGAFVWANNIGCIWML